MSPIDRLLQMSELRRAMTIEKARTQTPEFVSYPWTWILSPRGYGEEDFLGYRQIINPAIWVIIIPTMGYMLYDFIRRKGNVCLLFDLDTNITSNSQGNIHLLFLSQCWCGMSISWFCHVENVGLSLKNTFGFASPTDQGGRSGLFSFECNHVPSFLTCTGDT